MDRNAIEEKAQKLISRVARGCTSQFEGTWTLSVYDTAWVAMIRRPDGTWLFPESFDYVLHEQQEKSGWAEYATDIDAILNTMAGVLAIQKHLCDDTITEATRDDLTERSNFGVTYLSQRLNEWDVTLCMHVGFEVLVPALLRMLGAAGIELDFAGKKALMDLNAQKLRNFSPKYLYGKQQMTAIHSLEAFIGQIDFNSVRHHKVGGSMLGSPSATAAFLMGVSEWDEEAENYLQACIQHGGGKGLGGVPSAYPCDIFEFTWVLTTFVQSGMPHSFIETTEVAGALDIVASQLQANGGLVGFSSGMLPDTDDTAKAVYLLNLRGRSTKCNAMISKFQSPHGHMLTYLGERNLSQSANCNALVSILNASELLEHRVVVSQIANSLCDHWCNNVMKDKWNLSSKYTTMLLAQTFVELLLKWSSGSFEAHLDGLIKERIITTLYQIMNRLLFQSQSLDDTAHDLYTENVAYDILAANAIRSLPLPPTVIGQLDDFIHQKQEYLRVERSVWESEQYLWIEKVTYGSRTLSEAYCLAALYASSRQPNWNSIALDLLQHSNGQITKLSKFFWTAQGRKDPLWKFEACILEGSSFTSQLRAYRTEIFPLRHGIKDHYLAYIPAAWTIVNNFRGLNLPTNVLWAMMKFSLLDYLVDEYMESRVTLLSASERATIKSWISSSLLPEIEATSQLIPRKRPLSPVSDSDDHDTLKDESTPIHVQVVQDTLGRYIKEVLSHSRIRTASKHDRCLLKREMHDFLIAHMQQMEDNERLQSAGEASFQPSRHTPYHSWVRSTGAQHTSGPLSFAFFSCLLATSTKSKERQDCFPTPTQKYKAADLTAHLSILSRMFNDYSSVPRDRKEGNLNSLDFPEFRVSENEQTHLDQGLGTKRQSHDPLKSLLQLGEYHRYASRQLLVNLVGEIRAEPNNGGGAKTTDICKGLELFVYVTELFADMYLAKDLTNSARPG